MKRTCEELLIILKNLDKALDCTFPEEELAEKIGFKLHAHSGVDVSIAVGGDGKFKFSFELWKPYEPADYAYIDVDDTIFDQYL